MTADHDALDDAVAAYKTVLRQALERRPSGMRQRLAEALGTTRSFVSQITNPAYATPIPAPYVATILEVCHFAEGERARFLEAYRRAHPRRGATPDGPGHALRSLTLSLPDLGRDDLNAELDAMIIDLAERLGRLVGARIDDRSGGDDP